MECIPPSDDPEHSSPIPLTSHKKVRFTSPTIFPPLLSVVDQTDAAAEGDWDTQLLPWAEDPTFNPRGAEFEYNPISIPGKSGWYMNEDWSVDDTSTSGACDNHLFSQFFPTNSSPISSANVSEVYGGETIGVNNISDLGGPSLVVDGDANFDALFDQYLRSPSPSPLPSPCSPPKDAISDLSRTTLTGAEGDRSCDETSSNRALEDVRQSWD